MAASTTTTSKVVSAVKKRKRANLEHDPESLEIDLDAPEPASKKALRKAKRVKVTTSGDEDRAVGQQQQISQTTNPDEAKPNPGRSPYGVWIGNLPFFVNKTELQSFLTNDSNHAILPDQITRVHLPQGTPKPGFNFQNKGFAYIDFAAADVVDTALKLSEKLLGGRRVLIKSSRDFKGRPQSKSSEPTKMSSKRVFVGNLSFDVTKEVLQDHFEICGPIENVHVATFEDSGKCKGYAWVEFEQLPSAESAVRGWVEINDSAENDEKEKQTDSLDKTRRKRRIFVNKIGRRPVRMEFAEDKATRYEKRFGKGSRSQEVDRLNTDKNEPHSVGEGGPQGVEEDFPDVSMPRKEDNLRKDKRRQPDLSRYSETTVQKMTGAITEGTGSKITFD
jgi:RNA recognition motif-containing protein